LVEEVDILYFFLLGEKKKKSNKKEDSPAPVPKLKIKDFF